MYFSIISLFVSTVVTNYPSDQIESVPQYNSFIKGNFFFHSLAVFCLIIPTTLPILIVGGIDIKK